MIYSVSYRNSRKQEADEIRCPYNQLGLIWGKADDKRLNITVDSIGDRLFEQLDIVRERAYTTAAADLKILKTLLDRGYNSYWDVPITDWETFNSLIEIGVSDIWIDGPLCFDAEALAAVEDVMIRISPTLSPTASISGVAANSFFIRPEDIPTYLPIVDVIDFATPSIEQEEALFSIYKRGSYDGPLNSLIKDIPYNIPNALIAAEFAENRKNCRQLCKIPNRTLCEYCKSYLSFVEKTADYFHS